MPKIIIKPSEKTTLSFTVTEYAESPMRYAKRDITVYCEFDPDTEEVSEIKVYTYDFLKARSVNLTGVFQQNPILSDFVESINWPEVYANKKKEDEEEENEY